MSSSFHVSCLRRLLVASVPVFIGWVLGTSSGAAIASTGSGAGGAVFREDGTEEDAKKSGDDAKKAAKKKEKSTAKKTEKKVEKKTGKKDGDPGSGPAEDPAGGKDGEAKEGDAAADPAETKDGPADSKTTKALDPDQQFIRDNLDKFLSPSKVEFLDGGKVHLVFDFGERKDEHMGIFTPPVSHDARSKFRWSLDGEFTMGSWNRATDEDFSGGFEGLRISNEGTAHLNAWFQDDVEVEIQYAQSVSSTPRQIVAVVYTNGSGNSLGSNYGSQCAVFSGGRLKSSTGEYESIKNETATRLKLVLKEGKFYAYRDAKKRSEAPYPRRSFAAGRVGFVWAGGVASFIHKLEITGTLDVKKMSQLLRKGKL